MVLNTALLAPKTTRTTIGVAAMSLKKKATLDHVSLFEGSTIKNGSRYRSKALPAAGAILKEEDAEDQQLSLEM